MKEEVEEKMAADSQKASKGKKRRNKWRRRGGGDACTMEACAS